MENPVTVLREAQDHQVKITDLLVVVDKIEEPQHKHQSHQVVALSTTRKDLTMTRVTEDATRMEDPGPETPNNPDRLRSLPAKAAHLALHLSVITFGRMKTDDGNANLPLVRGDKEPMDQLTLDG